HGPDRDLHAHVPALRRPGRVRGLGRLRALRPLPLRPPSARRPRAAVVERPPPPRLSDRRDPDLRRAARPGRVAFARRALLRAGGPGSARDRRAGAAAGLPAPPDRGEPLACDPLWALG